MKLKQKFMDYYSEKNLKAQDEAQIPQVPGLWSNTPTIDNV